MSKDLGLSVGAGLASALLFLSVLAGVAPGFLFTYVAPLPLMAVGLRSGLTAAVIGGIAGIGGTILVTGGMSAPAYFVAVVLPSLVVVRQSLLSRTNADGSVEWYPPGLLLSWLTMAAMGLIGVAALFAPEHPDGLEGLMRATLESALAVLSPGSADEIKTAMLDIWTPVFPALVAGSWLLMAVVNAVLAQWALNRFGQARRPVPAYRALELPDWMAVALVAAVAAGTLGGDGSIGFLGRNLAVLVMVPYVFLGLTLVHDTAGKRPNARAFLAMFYVAFVFAFGWLVIAVAGLGLVRHWYRLRRRMGGGSQEEE